MVLINIHVTNDAVLLTL